MPDLGTASDEQLLGWLATFPPRQAASMKRLLQFSMLAGAPRGLLDRFLARPGMPAGPGEPHRRRHRRRRLRPVGPAAVGPGSTRGGRADGVGTSSTTASMASPPAPEHTPLRPAVDAFLADHGHRGNDEYELATPAWVMDPTPVYAAIDRLRHVPPIAIRSCSATDSPPTPTRRWPRHSGSCPGGCGGSPAAARWCHGRVRSAVSGPRTSSCSRTWVPASCSMNWFAGQPSAAGRPTSASPSASRPPSWPTSSPHRAPSPT